jgi:hypothetical protein
MRLRELGYPNNICGLRARILSMKPWSFASLISKAGNNSVRINLSRTARKRSWLPSSMGDPQTNVDTPPARRPPFGCHIVADTPVADVEGQRLAAAATGREARQAIRLRMLHLLRVCANGRFVEQRQCMEILNARHGHRIEPQACEKIAPIGHLSGIHQQRAQALGLQRSNLLRAPPLGPLHAAAHGHACMALQPFMQREQPPRNQRRVHRR